MVKEKKIQSDLDRISDYCADSDLLMNYDKFFKITFSRNFNLSQSTYMMNVITIKKITIIRDIRVIFESRLIFSNQIESVVPFILCNSRLNFGGVIRYPQYEYYIDILSKSFGLLILENCSEKFESPFLYKVLQGQLLVSVFRFS